MNKYNDYTSYSLPKNNPEKSQCTVVVAGLSNTTIMTREKLRDEQWTIQAWLAVVGVVTVVVVTVLASALALAAAAAAAAAAVVCNKSYPLSIVQYHLTIIHLYLQFLPLWDTGFTSHCLLVGESVGREWVWDGQGNGE